MDLQEIKAAVEKTYIALPITFDLSDDPDAPKATLNLRNALRLSEDEQNQVEAIGAELGEASTVSAARPLFKRFLEVLSGDADTVQKFLTVIGDDLAIVTYVLEEYQRVTQVEKA